MTAIRDLKSVCEFVHFPMQAGSDRILKKMHRIYTIDQYLEKVDLLKKTVPNVSLGTDIIVGFPSETDEEFQMTYDHYKNIGYSVGFIFSYSPRKGTPAFRWKDDISEEVKNERLHKLLDLQAELANQERHNMLGQVVEVLVEKRIKDEKFLKGRTRCWKNVHFEGSDALIGTLQKVTVTGFSHQTLHGKLQGLEMLKLI
jgi:tRNA-2-methylthio-N6-dimethylallyladenosine synthase